MGAASRHAQGFLNPQTVAQARTEGQARLEARCAASLAAQQRAAREAAASASAKLAEQLAACRAATGADAARLEVQMSTVQQVRHRRYSRSTLALFCHDRSQQGIFRYLSLEYH